MSRICCGFVDFVVYCTSVSECEQMWILKEYSPAICPVCICVRTLWGVWDESGQFTSALHQQILLSYSCVLKKQWRWDFASEQVTHAL